MLGVLYIIFYVINPLVDHYGLIIGGNYAKMDKTIFLNE